MRKAADSHKYCNISEGVMAAHVLNFCPLSSSYSCMDALSKISSSSS